MVLIWQIISNYDRVSVGGEGHLRYSKIPRSILFGDSMTYACRFYTLIAFMPFLFGTELYADFVGMTSDRRVEFVQATKNAVVGTHDIVVTTQGERAFVTAITAQTVMLAHDELLVVNGFEIFLEAGLMQDGVIRTINQYSDQTGAVAEMDFGSPLSTRIRTIEFGLNQSVSVISIEPVLVVAASGHLWRRIKERISKAQ